MRKTFHVVKDSKSVITVAVRIIMRVVVLALTSPHVFAQDRARSHVPEPVRLDDVLSARRLPFLTPSSLSPDGQQLAYTVQDPRRVGQRNAGRQFTDTGVPSSHIGCDVWLTDTKTRESTNLTQGKGTSWGPVWSPDGIYLAFYSDRDGQEHLWLWERRTAKLRRASSVVVHPRDEFEMVRWAPDSRRLLVKILSEQETLSQAVAETDDAEKVAGERREWEQPDIRIYRSQELHSASSTSTQISILGDPWTRALHADLALLDISSGSVLRLTRNLNPQWYAFSPDGSQIAVAHKKGQAGNNNWRSLYELILVSIDGRTRALANFVQSSPWAQVSWSPNAKSLAYLASGSAPGEVECYIIQLGEDHPRKAVTSRHDPLSNYDQVSAPLWDKSGTNILLLTNRSVLLISAKDTVAREVGKIAGHELTGMVGLNDRSSFWSPDNGRSVIVTTSDDETRQQGFYSLDLQSGTYTRLLEGNKSYGPYFQFRSVASVDEKAIVFVAEDAQHCPNLWMADAGFRTVRQITDINPQLSAYIMGEPKLITWKGLDGETLHGALLLPAGYKAGEKYPLIVFVYGDSKQSKLINNFGFYTSSNLFNAQIFATRGYAVLFPDSTTRVGTPMRDIASTVMPGVKEVVALGIADANRVGVMGHSFGGYSTLALGVQTDQFKAAVMIAGFGDLFALYSEMASDGSAFGIGVIEDGQGKMRGTPWEFRQRYIENSPVFYLDQMKAPLLIIHGSDDPAAQSFLADQVFVLLRRLGREALYVRYEGEGHGIEKYTNQLDCTRRIIEWFDKHLKTDPLVPGSSSSLPRIPQ